MAGRSEATYRLIAMPRHLTIDQLSPQYQAQIRAQLNGGKPIGLARAEEMGAIKIEVAPAKKRLRQSSKPLENELEKRWRRELESRYPDVKFRPQAKRFRLANGLKYTPDVTAIMDGREIAFECKGPKVFRGGFENLKTAAATWPEVKWILVWEHQGAWMQQEILP